MDEAALRHLAEQIRAELPTLIISRHERGKARRRLDAALALPAGGATESLTDALRSNPALLKRLEEDDNRAIALPGDAVAQLGVLYVCPAEDYSVVHDRVSDQVQFCPECGRALVRTHQ